MNYETKGALKFAEQDIFSEGCVSAGAYSTFVDYPIQGNTLSAVLSSIADFTGCEVLELQIDACGEPGRVDAGVMESEEGFAATKGQLERWKTGNCKLWYCVYSFMIDEVTRKPATLGATV